MSFADQDSEDLGKPTNLENSLKEKSDQPVNIVEKIKEEKGDGKQSHTHPNYFDHQAMKYSQEKIREKSEKDKQDLVDVNLLPAKKDKRSRTAHRLELSDETQNSQYLNLMADIKEKYPEFRQLENNELELVLKLYDDHFTSTFTIANPSYYVSGALVLLVSFMFVNA